MSEPNPFLPGAPQPESDLAPAVLEWTAQTRSGNKKSLNDDAWLVFASDINGADLLGCHGKHSLAVHDLIFGVSDGMGGGNAGDVASRLMLEQLRSMIPRTFKTAAEGLRPGYFTHLQQAIQAVHLAINAQAAEDESKKGMAATLALAWFTPENLYFANVGDSRIYLHRKGKTSMLTLDHTFAWKKFNRGEISERQFRVHPKRSVLYQVVGGGKHQAKPNIVAFPYQPGDRFLICSDGLIDGLWEKHIHDGFIKNRDSTRALASSLMDRAASNDGRDDITLITMAVNTTEDSTE
ncbi:MAG: protein phosphatase 2C domain-containing protein [Akkermansiaceae bacterium]|nr:protein phosphatase 2C domain-containing protein [Akkermansiaceae bacterium]